MVMYEIKKGKLSPKETQRNSYPFSQMEVNDYFEFPFENLYSIRNAAYGFGYRNNMKFSVIKSKNGTYQCWRIK